jgi:1-aminocyclopropane-1-carboxylate deaminase
MRSIRELGAQIEFLPPEVYDVYDESHVRAQFQDSLFIPEGGFHVNGIKGAKEISLHVMPEKANQIILAGGSICTAVGLLSSLSENTTLHIVPAWKGCMDSYVQQLLYTHGIVPACSWKVWPDFHFGGFSKWNTELLGFMKDFFERTLIPLDPVYTGKMMYALRQMLRDGYFASTDKVLAIHTGGLQGVEGFAYRFPQEWKAYADQIKING